MDDEVLYCENPLCRKLLDPADHVRPRGQSRDGEEYIARPVLQHFCSKDCWAEAVNNDELLRALYESYRA
jgi:hypothetical protein